MSRAPKLAVVGHPNKGKSSIVSALSRDDRVVVSGEPGTTKKNSEFTIKLGGRELFTLIDTPGFQRPRRALKWMKKREAGADSRPGIVGEFAGDNACQNSFPDEVELLRPVVAGAGILYVVDGSTPYGPEYDAELEILRWTGQPRMALINPIGDAEYLGDWRRALGQYFSIVRVFDALKADFEKQTELLRAFSQLNEQWREPLESAACALEADREESRKSAAAAIAHMLSQVLTLKVSKKLPADEPSLEAELKAQIVKLESECRRSVERAYNYETLRSELEELRELEELELFSEESWKLFGLKKRELLTFSALGGAAIGGGLDVMVGGSSLMMGSLVGAALGAGTSFFAGEKLVDSKIIFLPLGQRELVVGPVKSISLPHVLLERARLHHALLVSRTHANRKPLDFKSSSVEELDSKTKRSFERVFRKVRRKGEGSGVVDELRKLVSGVIW